jgi:hypothetical protein
VQEGRQGSQACTSPCHSQYTVIADHSQSASHMETTMTLLKTRVQSRLALHKQFASLGELSLGTNSHSDNTGIKQQPFMQNS